MTPLRLLPALLALVVLVACGGAGGSRPPPPADTTSPVVSGVTVGTPGATSATVSWTTDEPATSAVEYGASAAYGSTSTTAGRSLAHAVALAGLAPATTYHFRVRSADAAGNVALGPDATLQTAAAPDTTPPSVPAGLTATPASPSRIDLAWSASTDDVGVTAYLVTRDGAAAATVTSTSWSDTGLATASPHAYTVAARDAAGNVSASSAPVQATTFTAGADRPTLVQHLASSTNAPGKTESGNHFRFTLPNPVLPGNCLVLGIAYGASGTLAATPVTDTNGTWPTTPAAVAVDAAGNVDLAIFVLPDAAPGVHTLTVHFTGNVIPFQYTVTELAGIATVNPVSGSTSRSLVQAPDLSAGTFTPEDNDAAGGNAIWALFWDDASPGSGNDVTGFTAGAGFELLDANVAWHRDASCHHASEWGVQAAAAPITPALTAAMAPQHDPFVGLAIALRAARAGTPPGGGLRIVRILHFTNETFGTGPFRLQAPSSGNTLLLVTHEDFIVTIAALTDSKGNAWTQAIDGSGRPQFWVAPGAQVGGDLALTLTIAGTPQPASFTVYDLAGAAAAPIGATGATDGFLDISGASSVSDFPALTPGAPDGLAIAACGLGQGPALGYAAGAPAGAFFDFVNYAGQTDGSTMNNSDCRGHVWTASTATLHWNWVLTPIGNNSGSASALHVLAP
ncbi:MAG: fibronectin type III domain-containing protein [Anaeromyxobacteraceae bacterium]